MEQTVPPVVTQRYEPAIPVDQIQAHPQNPHEADTGPIRQSIDANGFYGAVIVQEHSNIILAGEHRWKSAMEEGAETVPVIFVDVDDVTAMRIMLADNRTSDLASYDLVKQANALRALVEQRDKQALAAAGYSEGEYDSILRGADTLLSQDAGRGQGAAAAKPPGLKDAFTLITVGRFKAHVEKNTFAEWYSGLIEELGTDETATLSAEVAKRLQIRIQPVE